MSSSSSSSSCMPVPADDSKSATTSGTIVLDDTLSPVKVYEPHRRDASKTIFNQRVEYYGFKGAREYHGLVQAVHTAFQGHRPLKLIPDDLWTTTLQGLGHHVGEFPEKFRSQLVTHAEGKQDVRIRHDEFSPGRVTGEQWIGVCHELREKSMEHVAPDSTIVRTVMGPNFTTTGELHRLLYSASVLSTLQHYLTYTLDSFCGIPRIILGGTVADWDALLAKVIALDLTKLDPALAEWDQFLRMVFSRLAAIRLRMDTKATTADDVAFFKSFYKWKEGSGGDKVTGWIAGLFPYLAKQPLASHLPGVMEKLNATPPTPIVSSSPFPFQEDVWRYDSLGAVPSDSFPTGLTNVPFIWNLGTTQHSMIMYVGFDQPVIDSDGVCQTAIGFAVAYAGRG